MIQMARVGVDSLLAMLKSDDKTPATPPDDATTARYAPNEHGRH